MKALIEGCKMRNTAPKCVVSKNFIAAKEKREREKKTGEQRPIDKAVKK